MALFTLKDYEDKILLQHRSSFEDTLPDYWAFFGGSLKDGETPDQAVRREAREELGINLEELKFFKRFEFNENEQWVCYVFTAKFNRDIDQLRQQQREGDYLDMFEFDDIEKLKVTNSDRVMLRELFS